MTINRTVRRLTERAMDLHHLTPKTLSDAVGCNSKSIYRILEEETVRMTQEQYFNLFTLAGAVKCVK